MVVETPYFLNINSGAISASSSATDTIDTGSNEEILVKEMLLISATGAFDLEITDNNGVAYQQEAVRWPIQAANPNQYIRHIFPTPLQFPRASQFKFKFTDVSAATNQVRIQLICIRKLETAA